MPLINPRRQFHHEQADNYCDVADGIGEETPAFANLCDQHTGDGWADNPRAVEHGRVQGNGVHQVFLAHHVHQESLACGDIKRIHHAQQTRQHKNVPHLHHSQQG